MENRSISDYEIIFVNPKEELTHRTKLVLQILIYTLIVFLIMLFGFLTILLQDEIKSFNMLGKISYIFSFFLFFFINKYFIKKEKFYFSWIKKLREKSIERTKKIIKETFRKTYHSGISAEKRILEAVFTKKVGLKDLKKNPHLSPFINVLIERLKRIKELEEKYLSSNL